MKPQIGRVCFNCGDKFWRTPGERGSLDGLCDDCYELLRAFETEGKRKKEARKKAEAEAKGDSTDLVLSDEKSVASELRFWANEAHKSYPVRKATLLEKITLRGDTPQRLEQQRQAKARNAVDAIVDRERTMLDSFKEIQVARMETETELMEARNRLRRKQLEAFEIDERIEHHQALRDERLRTKELEETRKQTELLREIAPPAPALPSRAKRPLDPTKQAITEQRRRYKARTDEKQLLFTDFLSELHKIFVARQEDAVKATRIRMAMETYKQDEEGLPKLIREFLDNVERGEEVKDAEVVEP